MQPAIYIISGLPGTGKSTVSLLLARRFARGVHIEADLVQQMILSGGVWPEYQPREEAMRQFELRRRNVSTLADSFVEAGFTTVIDDIVTGPHINQYRAHVRNRPLLFVMLVPAPDVIRAREASRGKHVFDRWAEADQSMREEDSRAGLWLDTSAQTAEETVDEIVARAGEAVIE